MNQRVNGLDYFEVATRGDVRTDWKAVGQQVCENGAGFCETASRGLLIVAGAMLLAVPLLTQMVP